MEDAQSGCPRINSPPFKSAEQRWLNDERYDLILRQTHTIVFEFHPGSGRHFYSPYIGEYLGGNYDGRELSDVFMEDEVVHPKDREVFAQLVEETIKNGGNRRVALRLKSSAGGYHWYRLTVATMRMQDESQIIVGTIVDTDEEVRMRESLRYRAEYDETTGIFNKTSFYSATEKLLWAHPNERYNILYLDIDRFKMINDLFGITEGDMLLRFLGRLIAKRMREGETYGRIRDDVFCMCLHRTDRETVKLIEELDKALQDYPLSFKFVPSVGIYRVEGYDGEPISIMCDRASLAQKTVKGNFITRYAFYHPDMGRSLFREQEVISEMHSAIEQGQFTAYYQPKHTMPDGFAFGSEALVRWIHPQKGLIPPGDFIPLFEKNGFITRLDEYVWELVCRHMRGWIDKGLTPLPVSVNVSRVHLYDPQLCDKFIGLVSKYRLDPGLLQIELTESAYVENPHFLLSVMETLHKRGFVFLMDDFGSGYSSLNMLRSIPVDCLKIDLNFLGFSAEDLSGKIILESTIQMARRLRIPVIVEGVETAGQADMLWQAGCTQAQGYYYSRPMPMEVFEKSILSAGRPTAANGRM